MYLYLFSRVSKSSKELLSVRQCLYWVLGEKNIYKTSPSLERGFHTSQTSSFFITTLQRPKHINISQCTRATLPIVCVRQLNGGGRRIKRSSSVRRKQEINPHYNELQGRLPSVAHRVWVSDYEMGYGFSV